MERHAYCEDLVQQFVGYCLRKERENPDWTHEFNLKRLAKALTQKSRTGEWDITVEEQGWMLCLPNVGNLCNAGRSTELAPPAAMADNPPPIRIHPLPDWWL